MSRTQGRAWLIGDSVDTNQLAGGGIDGGTWKETLRLNCLRGIRPDFADSVQSGDFLVAGTNFGCGSARQTAVEALQLSGIIAVFAESVARIHYRNSIALALPTFVVPGISSSVSDGDQLQLDQSNSTIWNLTTGAEIHLPKLPQSVRDIYAMGGILEVIRQRLTPSDE